MIINRVIETIKDLTMHTHCEANEIIDALTGVCFSEQEAGELKERLAK